MALKGMRIATRKTKIRPRAAAAKAAGPIGDTQGERHNQLRMALEAADIGLWDWDLPSNRIVMSANMKTLLEIGNGGRDESFETFLQVIHPDDRARIVDALNKAIEKKSPFDVEFRTTKRDRTVR